MTNDAKHLWVFPPEDSSLVRAAHACNSIHYTYRKLIDHILLETRTSMRQKLNIASLTTAIDRAVFVTTNLEKYTSYEDAIKSNI